MGMGMSEPQRGDVYLVSLDPTKGREIKKTRPCVIVSPDELNAHLSTFIVAPMTTGGHPYPFRLPCRFQRKDGIAWFTGSGKSMVLPSRRYSLL